MLRTCYSCDYYKFCVRTKGYFPHEVESFEKCSAWRLFNQGERLKAIRWKKADRKEKYDSDVLEVGTQIDDWIIEDIEEPTEKRPPLYKVRCRLCGNMSVRFKHQIHRECKHKIKIGHNRYITDFRYTLKGKTGLWEPVRYIGPGDYRNKPVWEWRCKSCGAVKEDCRERIVKIKCECQKKGEENGKG